jgi:hypothetical protein
VNTGETEKREWEYRRNMEGGMGILGKQKGGNGNTEQTERREWEYRETEKREWE